MKPRPLTSIFLLALAMPLFAFAPPTSPAAIPETRKLISSNPQEIGQFGHDVAVDGDTAVVGAYNETANGLEESGAVYVYVRQGGANWSLQATLTPADAVAEGRFGTSVAIHGNTLVVGAIGQGENGQPTAGAAYVFLRQNGVWTQRAKLVAAEPEAGDSLGTDVAVNNTNALIGTLGNNPNDGALLFTRTTSGWVQHTKFVSDAADPGHFGQNVAIHGNYALIGAYDEDVGGFFDAGAVYVYVRHSNGTWHRQAKLTAPDIDTGEWFGASVALREGVAVIGAPFWRHEDSAPGAAYVFTRSGAAWPPTAQLLPPNLFRDDALGQDVAIGNGFIVAGAPGANAGIGIAYVFREGQLTGELAPSDGQANDQFGHAVSAAALNAVVGAPFASPGGVSAAGAAYLYRP